MVTTVFIIGIIIISGLARLYVNRKYDVEQEKQNIREALHRNNKAREKNANTAAKA